MKSLLTVALLLLSVLSGASYADIALQSKAEIEGTWKLQFTKNSLNDKNALPREDTWVFNGDKVTILHIPREGKYYDQPAVNYEIEDGKLKVALIGNSRFDVFSLIDKDAHAMTLKGKFGGYYYFTKK